MSKSASFLVLIVITLSAVIADEFDADCYPDFPIKDGLLCYKKCDPGYPDYGTGPVCWGKCPSDTTDIGISCAKDSYGRGAGTPLHACGDDQEKNGLLCYPNCKSGYYGVGPVCWERCESDWTDTGIFCSVLLKVYSRDVSECPWYDLCGLIWGFCGERCGSGFHNDGCFCRRPPQTRTKNSYGRGVGEPMGCASDEDLNGALCYPKCRSGYVGVGPVCWSTCSGETTDTGAFCQKDTYGRGVGKPLTCIGEMSEAYAKKQDVGELTDFLTKMKSETLTKAVCMRIYNRALPLMLVLSTISTCNKADNWNTIVFSISGSVSAFITADAELGLAYDVKNNKASCYFQYCGGFHLDAGISISVNVGWFRSLADIPGKSNLVYGGLEIPFSQVGISVGGVTNLENEYIGTVTEFSLGVGISPLPFNIGASTCNTPEDEMITFTPL